jgi:hypothetical protein
VFVCVFDIVHVCGVCVWTYVSGYVCGMCVRMCEYTCVCCVTAREAFLARLNDQFLARGANLVGGAHSSVCGVIRVEEGTSENREYKEADLFQCSSGGSVCMVSHKTTHLHFIPHRF